MCCRPLCVCKPGWRGALRVVLFALAVALWIRIEGGGDNAAIKVVSLIFRANVAVTNAREGIIGTHAFHAGALPTDEARALTPRARRMLAGYRGGLRGLSDLAMGAIGADSRDAVLRDAADLPIGAQRGSGCVITELFFSARDGVPVRMLRWRRVAGRDASAAAAAASTKANHTLLWMHGGGWVFGSAAETMPARYCATHGMQVFSLDYRMAPEWRFPTAPNDVHDALRWLMTNADALDVNVARVSVGGASAGGNLAAVAALDARDDTSLPAPLFAQFLHYPSTTLQLNLPSHSSTGDWILDGSIMLWFRALYVDATDFASPRASPLLAASHKRLPRALLLVCGRDVLRDDAIYYAQALREAGVAVRASFMASAPHVCGLRESALDDSGVTWDDHVVAVLQQQ